MKIKDLLKDKVYDKVKLYRVVDVGCKNIIVPPYNLEDYLEYEVIKYEIYENMNGISIDFVKPKEEHSNIDHPAHYNHGGLETIDKIKNMLTAEEFKGFLKGNIIKYIDRADYKGHKEEDLGKADWYLRKLKEEEK